ncbi:MAG: MMPL family transporter, partial [Thermomicrobiales bacterium]
RANGRDNVDAVQHAMETAGHAVLFSGTTVGVGLVALAAIPIPFMRGMGVGSVIIPIVSVLVSLTLLPVILATVGPALDRVGWKRSGTPRKDEHRGWTRWGAFVVRHRWPAAIVGVAILLALVIPATQMKLGDPRPDALNGTGGAAAGLAALEQSGIGPGVLDAFEIVVHTSDAAVAGQVAQAAATVDGVRTAVAPASWMRNGIAVVLAVPQNDGSGEANAALLPDLRHAVHSAPGTPLVGGRPAANGDLIDTLYHNFPLMLAAIAVATYVLLVRAFRSLLLPLKALALNVLSVGAAYGVLVLVWQEGWGSEAIWGIPSTGSITAWVPLMTFAFLFGLSMDYEVFILHRMREEYDREEAIVSGRERTDRAIVRGLAATGKLVTCAALILCLAFIAMAGTPATEIKIMATGLAAGIIIDATVVRTLLVPAITSLMGHWNWWLKLPSWLTWLIPAPSTTPQPAEPVVREAAHRRG